MKYQHQIKSKHVKIARMVGIVEPPDGFTDEEKAIARVLSQNTVVSLYRRLPTPRMKAIASMLDHGYTQQTIAEIFGCTQERISVEIRTIRKVLKGGQYNPHREKQVSAADVITMIHSMIQ